MLTGDDPETLRALCNKCRCLARGASNTEVSASLSAMAADYERAAQRAEAAMSAQAHAQAPRLLQSAH